VSIVQKPKKRLNHKATSQSFKKKLVLLELRILHELRVLVCGLDVLVCELDVLELVLLGIKVNLVHSVLGGKDTVDDRVVLSEGALDNGKGLGKRRAWGLGNDVKLGIVAELVDEDFNSTGNFVDDFPIVVDIGRADLLLAESVDRDLVGSFLELVFLRGVGTLAPLVRRQKEAQVLLGKDADRERIHVNWVLKRVCRFSKRRNKNKSWVETFFSQRLVLQILFQNQSPVSMIFNQKAHMIF
jgi:hypothetical protein